MLTFLLSSLINEIALHCDVGCYLINIFITWKLNQLLEKLEITNQQLNASSSCKSYKTKQKTLRISLEMLSNDLQHKNYRSKANETFIKLIKADPGPESDQDSKQNNGMEKKKEQTHMILFPT